MTPFPRSRLSSGEHLRPSRALCAAILVLAVGAGCRRPAPPPTAPDAVAWRWEDFPEADELLLAQLPGSIQPAQVAIVRAPAAGRFVLDSAIAPGAALSAHDTWGRIEPTTPDPSSADLAALQSRLEARRAHYRRFEQPAALARLDRDIAAAEEALAVARFAEKSPELFRGDASALDPALRPPLDAAQAEIQLQRLRDERARLVSTDDPAAEPADLQNLQAELDRARRTQRLRDEQLTLTAPFAGRLQLAADPGRHVEPGEILATLADTSALEIRVPASLPLLHSVPAETLRATVTLPGGATADATFLGRTLEPQGAALTVVFRFRLTPPSGDATALFPATGAELPVLIYAHLPRSARIVPKLALVRFDRAGLLQSGWRAGLPRLFPGAEIIAEGRQALALAPAR